jgi:hypothetical protein
MAFLTIAGIDVEVLANEADDNEPIEMGEDVRTFNNNLRTTIRNPKLSMRFRTGPMTVTAANTLIAAITGGAHVPVTGDALNAVSITARVRYSFSRIADDSQLRGHQRLLDLVIEQV